ncbi:hypothetical protein [Sandaracinus amylolyticus]|uniref:hypothetical protein n=1 Tax=Sandaracinus amylolyticus TaxID=927083 RepID=UPI001F2E0394|nr:hypothetical protein [Sandaracinus amylolyticus]UJR79617.1 Hypothetical protein I5071_16550 [Sandaracinus amylolyticus]
MSEPTPGKPGPKYASYDGFLKTAIETYWAQRKNQVHFVALLLASREAWEVAWGGVTAPGTGRKVLTGAAGATAVVVALRLLVGGPIGLVLTGVSIASLGAVYARNHRRIWAQQERYRKLLGEYRVKYEQIRGNWIEGRIEEHQRDLMIDGLMNRLLDDIDEEPAGLEGDKKSSREERDER